MAVIMGILASYLFIFGPGIVASLIMNYTAMKRDFKEYDIYAPVTWKSFLLLAGGGIFTFGRMCVMLYAQKELRKYFCFYWSNRSWWKGLHVSNPGLWKTYVDTFNTNPGERFCVQMSKKIMEQIELYRDSPLEPRTIVQNAFQGVHRDLSISSTVLMNLTQISVDIVKKVHKRGKEFASGHCGPVKTDLFRRTPPLELN